MFSIRQHASVAHDLINEPQPRNFKSTRPETETNSVQFHDALKQVTRQLGQR